MAIVRLYGMGFGALPALGLALGLVGCGDDAATADMTGPADLGAHRDFARPPIDLTMGVGDAAADLASVDSHADLASGGDLAGMVDSAIATDLGTSMDQLIQKDLAATDMAVHIDMSVAMDMSVRMDLAVRDLANADLASASDGALSPDLANGGDGGAACHLLLNELQTGTTQTGNEEFVEIYNPCSADVALGAWKVGYRSQNNVSTDPSFASDDIYVTFASGAKVVAGGYFVVCENSFTKQCDNYYSGGFMANAAGAIALRDGKDNLVDSVGYGGIASSSLFLQGSAAPRPPNAASPGASIGRLPNGADTHDNSVDWKATTALTPDAANQ